MRSSALGTQEYIESGGNVLDARSPNVAICVVPGILCGITSDPSIPSGRFSILVSNALMNTYFDPWYSNFKQWESFCRDYNISKLQAALGFVKAENRISKIIIGIESCKQLKQILEAYLTNTRENFVGPCEDRALVNPLMWKIC